MTPERDCWQKMEGDVIARVLRQQHVPDASADHFPKAVGFQASPTALRAC